MVQKQCCRITVKNSNLQHQLGQSALCYRFVLRDPKKAFHDELADI